MENFDTLPKYNRMQPLSDGRALWLARHIVPHEPALRSWLRGKSSLGFDIDDVVQETYAILAAKDSIEAIRNPKTYSFQVAYSVILQQLRQSRVVPITAVADIGTLEAAHDEPSPEDTLLARDELALIRTAIDALPKQTRQAFILRRVEGLSQQAIARRMKLSEHTVEKHISRSLSPCTSLKKMEASQVLIHGERTIWRIFWRAGLRICVMIWWMPGSNR